MKKKMIQITGHIVQYAWADDLLFTHNIEPESGHEIYHRPITFEVPINTLAFDPSDEDARRDAGRQRQIEALTHKKARLSKEITETDEEIQSLLALPQSI